MPRDAKGRFTKEYDNGITIALPSFFSMLKIIIFAIIMYPWYHIATRYNFLGVIFENLFYGRPISMSGSDSTSGSKTANPY